MPSFKFLDSILDQSKSASCYSCKLLHVLQYQGSNFSAPWRSNFIIPEISVNPMRKIFTCGGDKGENLSKVSFSLRHDECFTH